MATIAPTSMFGSGQRTLVETTLTASNVFSYAQGSGQILILRNATGGALSPIIDGADGTTVAVNSVGLVDVSAGYAVGSIAAGAVKVIPLDTVGAYLQGAINISGATGIVASLMNF